MIFKETPIKVSESLVPVSYLLSSYKSVLGDLVGEVESHDICAAFILLTSTLSQRLSGVIPDEYAGCKIVSSTHESLAPRFISADGVDRMVLGVIQCIPIPNGSISCSQCVVYDDTSDT